MRSNVSRSQADPSFFVVDGTSPVDKCGRLVWGAVLRRANKGSEVEPPIKSPSTGSSIVEVRFTEVPVLRWASLPNETKRTRGIIGGGFKDGS